MSIHILEIFKKTKNISQNSSEIKEDKKKTLGAQRMCMNILETLKKSLKKYEGNMALRAERKMKYFSSRFSTLEKSQQ